LLLSVIINVLNTVSCQHSRVTTDQIPE